MRHIRIVIRFSGEVDVAVLHCVDAYYHNVQMDVAMLSESFACFFFRCKRQLDGRSDVDMDGF